MLACVCVCVCGFWCETTCPCRANVNVNAIQNNLLCNIKNVGKKKRTPTRHSIHMNKNHKYGIYVCTIGIGTLVQENTPSHREPEWGD